MLEFSYGDPTLLTSEIWDAIIGYSVRLIDVDLQDTFRQLLINTIDLLTSADSRLLPTISSSLAGILSKKFDGADSEKNQDCENIITTTEIVSNSHGNILKTHEFFFEIQKINYYGKVIGLKKGTFRKEQEICIVMCFTDGKYRFTKHIKANHDLTITELLVNSTEQVPNGFPLFRYTNLISSQQFFAYQQNSTNNETASNSYENILKTHEFVFALNKNNCYGKVIGLKKGSFRKGQEICVVICFTSEKSRFTKHILADQDLTITELLVNSAEQIWNGYPLFRYTDLIPSTQILASQQNSPLSFQEYKVASPAQEHAEASEIEGLDDFICMVKEAYAFQVRDVLERIVNTEKERIETERGLWKLGVGIIALGFGVSLDGFDAGDLFAGWTFSNIGGAAHQFASKEQVEFLKKLQSEWLVLDRSPMDIRRRLGEPQGRFIGISRANILDMFNIHQSGSRGFHMVELDCAGNIAKGFKDPQSLEVLQRSYDEEDIGIISSHLYPSTITPLRLCRIITLEEAKKKDPYFNQLSKAGAPFRVVYSDDTEGIMYKIQIPHHSDY